MRRFCCFLMILLFSLSLILTAQASRLEEAKEPVWYGGTVFLDEATGELISLETDEILLTGVTELTSDEESLWARTPDAWYQLSEDNTLTEAGYHPETDQYETLRYGFAITKSYTATTVHRLSDGAELLRRDGYTDIQVRQDERTGQVYILSNRGDILRADGTQVIPKATLSELVRDCHFSFAQNGYAFGYPEPFDEANPQATVIDLSTGETVAVLDGWWSDYVGWGMIYPDGTAVIVFFTEEDMFQTYGIVRYTTGEILLTTVFEIGLRHADEPCYILHAIDGTDYFFDPDEITTTDTSEMIHFLDSADQSESISTPISLKYQEDENGHFAGMRVLGTDGQPISEEIWQGVIPYDVHDVDLESNWPEIFNPDGGAEVKGFDGKRGILGLDGQMIIPAVCDEIDYCRDEGYLVQIDGTWEIYGVDGLRRY